jgi:hypothetical protein
VIVNVAGESSARHWTDLEGGTLAALLRRAGFDDGEVEPWLSAPSYVDVSTRAVDAVQWRDRGFSSGDAIQWDEATFDPQDARSWAAAGFSPLEAEYARTQVLNRSVNGDVRRMLRTEALWRSSGLTPLWVCRCLGAGVRTVAEAQALHRKAQSDSTVVGSLRLLAGLGGWDFSYLERA